MTATTEPKETASMVGMHHPIQPLIKDADGVVRFKENAIVRFLIEWAADHGCGHNDLARMTFTDSDRQQFAQLVGHSLSGYGNLPYVSSDAYEVAVMMSTSGADEKDARIAYLEKELSTLRAVLRGPMARLFGVDPDDIPEAAK